MKTFKKMFVFEYINIYIFITYFAYLPRIRFFFLIFIYYYLFLPALGLSHCLWAFSSYNKQGLLSSCRVWASHCSGFSCFRAQPREPAGSEAAAHRLSCPEA